VAKPLIVPLPPNLHLWGGCTVRVTAVDPDTGAGVAGVQVSNVTLEVDQTAGGPDDLAFGPFMLVHGPPG
jgi:hypothetical protein